MAKKKQTQSVPKVQSSDGKNLPAYIWQSYNISAMQADLSKQQIRILAGMMKSIQDGIQRMFERGPNKNNQLLLFPDMAENYINVDFKFSDIAVRPDAYRDVQVIADKFMTTIFRYEDKDLGEVTLEHFVHKVTYPKRGSKYVLSETYQALHDGFLRSVNVSEKAKSDMSWAVRRYLFYLQNLVKILRVKFF